MLFINNNVLSKIKNWQNYYILIDFDRTITTGNSSSSWDILLNDNKVANDYKNKIDELFKFYRPIELDMTIDLEQKKKLLEEWWNKHLNLFIEYNLEEKVIWEAAANEKFIKIRDGAQSFFKIMNEMKIPVIIVSAGIGNFIEAFLKRKHIIYDNIYIVANYLKFVNGKAVGLCDKIIHSCNKDEVIYTQEISKAIKGRKNGILISDSIDDIKMVNEQKMRNILKIGFLNDETTINKETYLKAFDIVGDATANFNDLLAEITLFH